jgi:hypothetical protein
MKRDMPTVTMILISVLVIAVIAQLTLHQTDAFSLASAVLLIFVLSYLLARIYYRYKDAILQ